MPESRSSASVARRVHGCVAVLSAGLLACVVPPPLGLDQADAGADASPVFMSVRGPDGKELVTSGTNNVVAHQDADFSLTTYDADAGDTLLVQVFVDYSDANPTAPRSTCQASPTTNSSLDRSMSCPVKAICLDADVTTGNPHSLLFEVYDGAVLNSPLMFRSVAPDRQKSFVSYSMTCLAPPS
jgi:hypothetical protein